MLEKHTSLPPPELWDSAGADTNTPCLCDPQASPLESVHLTRLTEMPQLHSLPSKSVLMPASLQDLGLDLPTATLAFWLCPWKQDCSPCRPEGDGLEYPQLFKRSASILFMVLPAAGADPTCADSGRVGSAP